MKYYDTFHRGLTFTLSGVYALCLILFVGLIAITTGINGLYIFLSSGLGGFVVSGILSERSMRSAHVDSLGAVQVDAHTAFGLPFRLTNSSRWFTVFGLETLFFTETPRYRLIAGPRHAVAKHYLTTLPPRSSFVMTAPCPGMPRGLYTDLRVMNLTTFPLGILEKYKVVKVASRIIVAPQVDPVQLREIIQSLHHALRAHTVGYEFFMHLPYQREQSHLIDWKKNAGKAPRDWVIKDLRTASQRSTVVIEAPWDIATGVPDQPSYERFLTLIRTALEAVQDLSLEFIFPVSSSLSITRFDEALGILAAAPPFEKRLKGLVPSITAKADFNRTPDTSAKNVARLLVTESAIRLETHHRQARG